MSDWFYMASDADLSAVHAAQRGFRDLWSTMRKPPFDAKFDGSPMDIDAMDYLHYEGFADPPCGIEGAALVWGEVLRQAAGMSWVISYHGDWMLTSNDEDVIVWPFARVFEQRQTAFPQFEKYQWALEKAIVDLLRYHLSDKVKAQMFRSIIPADSGYVQSRGFVDKQLEEWRVSSQQGHGSR